MWFLGLLVVIHQSQEVHKGLCRSARLGPCVTVLSQLSDSTESTIEPLLRCPWPSTAAGGRFSSSAMWTSPTGWVVPLDPFLLLRGLINIIQLAAKLGVVMEKFFNFG